MFKTLFIILSLLFVAVNANASIFPNSTKTAYLEIPINTGTTCGTILPATDHDRTIVYGTIRSFGDDLASITTDNGFVYLNNLKQNDITTFAPYLLLANQSLICTRANNKAFTFRVSYVDYDLSLVQDFKVVMGSVSFPDTVLLASTSHDTLFGQTASVSVYNTMTAGDLVVAIGLFCVIMLLFIFLFLNRI